MFTTPCYIRKNTQELREKLSNLGYSNYYDDDRSSNKNVNDEPFLFVDTYIEYDINSENIIEETPYYCCINADDLDGTYYGIDCGENEELFLATAALRNDSDKHQLFFHNKDIECEYPIECIHDKFHLIQVDEYLSKYKYRKNEYHKATVEELIKHFK